MSWSSQSEYVLLYSTIVIWTIRIGIAVSFLIKGIHTEPGDRSPERKVL
jgi:hypothetical protein